MSQKSVAQRSTPAVVDTPTSASFVEEAYRKFIADFALQIASTLKSSDWTTEQAAEKCRINQASLSDLLEGRTDGFTATSLLNVATTMGWKVHFTIEPA